MYSTSTYKTRTAIARTDGPIVLALEAPMLPRVLARTLQAFAFYIVHMARRHLPLLLRGGREAERLPWF